jgi:predicted anti-sigma-YlaC factor YlaD
VNCREMIDFLSDYIEGELPENVKMCFDMHLEMCPPCVEYLRTYRETIAIAKKCCCDDPGCDEMPEPLIQAILAARKAQ